MKRNGYFTFQAIIDKTGACGTTFSVCVDRRGAFRTVLDSKCCVMGGTKLTTMRNGYFTFPMIIGVRCATSDAVCVGLPVIIILYKKS